MIEVEVHAVLVSLISPARIVLLREKASPRFLPIWIGAFEAEAIAMHLQGVKVERPMTHDLMVNLLREFSATLKSVEVTDLHDDTFYARLNVVTGTQVHSVDARPSDAIALAVRVGVPIYVHERVMEMAGTVETPSIYAPPIPSVLEAGDVEGLDVYRDFLSTLDLDKLAPSD